MGVRNCVHLQMCAVDISIVYIIMAECIVFELMSVS